MGLFCSPRFQDMGPRVRKTNKGQKNPIKKFVSLKSIGIISKPETLVKKFEPPCYKTGDFGYISDVTAQKQRSFDKRFKYERHSVIKICPQKTYQRTPDLYQKLKAITICLVVMQIHFLGSF